MLIRFSFFLFILIHKIKSKNKLRLLAKRFRCEEQHIFCTHSRADVDCCLFVRFPIFNSDCVGRTAWSYSCRIHSHSQWTRCVYRCYRCRLLSIHTFMFCGNNVHPQILRICKPTESTWISNWRTLSHVLVAVDVVVVGCIAIFATLPVLCVTPSNWIA